MKFKQRTVWAIADMICGNTETGKSRFSRIAAAASLPASPPIAIRTMFTTARRVAPGCLAFWKPFFRSRSQAQTYLRKTFARIIRVLMDQGDATDGDPRREKALAALNVALAREGFEAFYGEDRLCYLRHVATNKIAPHDLRRTCARLCHEAGGELE
jgi:hypothetical protein